MGRNKPSVYEERENTAAIFIYFIFLLLSPLGLILAIRCTSEH